MYRPTKPRALDQPVTILIRPAIKGARASIELICCTNVRNGADTVSCGKRGGRDVVRTLRKEVRALGLDASVVTSGCLGSCNTGPNIRIAPSSSWMSGARVEDTSTMLDALVRIIAEQHAVAGPDESN